MIAMMQVLIDACDYLRGKSRRGKIGNAVSTWSGMRLQRGSTGYWQKWRGGWGTWIRTKTNRVRVCCATVTPFPNGLSSLINSLFDYLDKSPTPGSGQITARLLRRSTRSVLSLASAEEGPFRTSACANAPGFDGPLSPTARGE
jgi:hypothetical protein